MTTWTRAAAHRDDGRRRDCCRPAGGRPSGGSIL